MKKVITAAQAAAKIEDSAFIAMSGVNFAGVPMEIVDAIAERFKAEGHPRDISVIHSAGHAYVRPLVIEGLLGTYYPGFSNIDPAVIDENRIPVYSLAQGINSQFYRAQANDTPYLTKAGLHTYLDPRQRGGAANAKAAEKSIVEVVEVGGEEYLHYMLPPIKVALIRATTADTQGNLVNFDESVKHELLPLAMAAHNNGGIVIAQVKNLVELGSIQAGDVKVPGMLVDYIVVCSDADRWHPQSVMQKFHPGMTGYTRVPAETIPVEAWTPKEDRLVMVRRATEELRPGYVCNVGLGISDGVAAVAAIEGVEDMYFMSNELGAIGGVTTGGPFFSGAFNARAFMNHHEMFDFINGHGLDVTFLGAAEIGENGSVNVTKIAGRSNGSGGFVNISSSTKKVVFMTTLTVGGKAVVENGALKITKPGRPLKFVKEVAEIAFNGEEAMKKGQEILYITERAVFRLINGKVTLMEYAPGLDVERDIVGCMGFRPEISPDLKEMPAFCFETGPIGLREKWQKMLDGE